MIEYTYEYWANSYFPNSRFLGMLWVIPFAFLAQASKLEVNRLRNILFFIVTASVIIIFERSSINSRFVSIDPKNLEMTFVDDSKITLNRSEIKKVWSVHGKMECHLWVQTKSGQNYRSISVDERKEYCRKGAEAINNYRK